MTAKGSEMLLPIIKAFAKQIPRDVCAPHVADFGPLMGRHEDGGFAFYSPERAESSLWATLHDMDSMHETSPDRPVIAAALREFAEYRRKKALALPRPRIVACGHYSRDVFWADVETEDRGMVRVVGAQQFGHRYKAPTLADTERAQPQGEPW